MNTLIKTLAKQAGFVFWTDEDYGPGSGNIDWSCEYSNEFNTFVQLLIDECAKSLWTEECNTSDLAFEEFTRNNKKIKDHFAKRKLK